MSDFSSWSLFFLFLLRSTPYSQGLVFEAYISWRLLHKSWHKKRFKERSTGMRSLHPPPMKRQLGVPAQSHFVCALVFFACRPKYNRFQPGGFLFLNILQKSHLTWEWTILSISCRYWANGPTGWVFGMFFSRGEGGDDTGELWTVSIYTPEFANSTAIFVTATVLKDCNFWNCYLHQRKVYPNLRGGLASSPMLLPVLSCVAFTQFPICWHQRVFFLT